MIQAGVGFCLERGLPQVGARLRRLMTEGSRHEKTEYASAAGKTYYFPNWIETEAPSNGLRLTTNDVRCTAKRCVSSESHEVCNNRKICNLVCRGVAGGVGGAIGGGRGGIIGGIGGDAGCTQVCEFVPECRTVSTCLRYEWSGPGCF